MELDCPSSLAGPRISSVTRHMQQGLGSCTRDCRMCSHRLSRENGGVITSASRIWQQIDGRSSNCQSHPSPPSCSCTARSPTPPGSPASSES